MSSYRDQSHKDLRRIAKARNLKQGSHPTTDDLIKLLEDDDAHPDYKKWTEDYQREVLKGRNIEIQGKTKDELLALLQTTQAETLATAPSASGSRGSRASSEETVIMEPRVPISGQREDPRDKGHDGDGKEIFSGSEGSSNLQKSSSGNVRETERKGDQEANVLRQEVLPSVESTEDSTVMGEEESFEDSVFASSPRSRSPTRYQTSLLPDESPRATPAEKVVTFADSGTTLDKGVTAVEQSSVASGSSPTSAEAPGSSGTDQQDPSSGDLDTASDKPSASPHASSPGALPDAIPKVQSERSASMNSGKAAEAPEPTRRRGRSGLYRSLLARSSQPRSESPRKDGAQPSVSKASEEPVSDTTTANPTRRRDRSGLYQSLLARSSQPRSESPRKDDPPSGDAQLSVLESVGFSWREHFRTVNPVLPYNRFEPNLSRPKVFTDIGPFTADTERWVNFTDPWSGKEYDGFILGLSRKQQLIVEYAGEPGQQKSRGALLPVPLYRAKREEFEGWVQKNGSQLEIQLGTEKSLIGVHFDKIDRDRCIVFEFTASRVFNQRVGDTLILLRLVDRRQDKEGDNERTVQDRFYNDVHDHFYTRSFLEQVFGRDIKPWIKTSRPTPQHKKAEDVKRIIADFAQNPEVADLEQRFNDLGERLKSFNFTSLE